MQQIRRNAIQNGRGKTKISIAWAAVFLSPDVRAFCDRGGTGQVVDEQFSGYVEGLVVRDSVGGEAESGHDQGIGGAGG